MSTILDALHKARRERAHDAPVGSDRLDAVPGPPPRRRRAPMVWIVLLTVFATVAVLVVTGGAFVLLHARLVGAPPVVAVPAGAPVAGNPATTPATTPAATPAAPPSEGMAIVPTAATTELPVAGPEDPALLPTPLPAAMLPADPAPAPPATPDASATPTSVRTQDGMTLGSILHDANDRLATINGVPLREGESYDDFTVLRITPNAVTVQREGRAPVVLRMGR